MRRDFSFARYVVCLQGRADRYREIRQLGWKTQTFAVDPGYSETKALTVNAEGLHRSFPYLLLEKFP